MRGSIPEDLISSLCFHLAEEAKLDEAIVHVLEIMIEPHGAGESV